MSYLLALNSDTICNEGLQFIRENQIGDIDVSSLDHELLVRELFGESEIVCFKEVLPKEDERALIPNVQILIELLMINPSTSATPERSFSSARRLKTWQQSTMKQKRFNSLAILHEHKELTDKQTKSI